MVVNETKLIRDLLRDYEPDARPVKNQSDSVRVELQMIYKELKEIVCRKFFPQQELLLFIIIHCPSKTVSLMTVPLFIGGTEAANDFHYTIQNCE